MAHTCDRHPTGTVGGSDATRRSGSDSVGVRGIQAVTDVAASLTTPLSNSNAQTTSAAPRRTAGSTLLDSSSAPLSNTALVLPISTSPQAASVTMVDADAAALHIGARDGHDDGASTVMLPLSSLSDPFAGSRAVFPSTKSASPSSEPTDASDPASSSQSGSSVQLLSGWEFVQSFGDDETSYDFADADDLVTAVEFHPSGEYLAIGDKAGRVSIVEEATLRTDGGSVIRGRNAHDSSDEQSADDEDGVGLHNPLEFR